MHYPSWRLDVQLPCVMGILNTTPDSFSRRGPVLRRGRSAVAHALQMARDGAAILDIGGESTRPGSDPVSSERGASPRAAGVERLVAECPAPVSVDTMKAAVARRGLDAGAVMINDVSALRYDPQMVEVVAARGCPLCLMHMQGLPKTMQDDPRYDDVVDDVAAFLEERMAFAVAAGVAEDQISLDPGLGFGKTARHNLLLLKHLDRLTALGRPVVLGASRKRFLGAVLGAEPEGRVVGTVATTVLGAERGAAVFRVHDVRPNYEALRTAMAPPWRSRNDRRAGHHTASKASSSGVTAGSPGRAGRRPEARGRCTAGAGEAIGIPVTSSPARSTTAAWWMSVRDCVDGRRVPSHRATGRRDRERLWQEHVHARSSSR